jgi:Putative phage holin Dp-1
VLPDNQNGSKMLNKQLYDALKFLAQIGAPAVGTFYFALAQIWGIPSGQQVVGSIMAFDVFLGVLLGLSSKVYNSSDAKYDGSIDVLDDPEAEKKTYSLTLHSDPDDLDSKKEILFKVNPLQ